MRNFVGIGWIATACVVGVWRGIAELVSRRRALAVSGELEARIAVRRNRRVEQALERSGLGERRVPPPVRAPASERVHAVVHVGAVDPMDHDDVGLLEAAMRRSVRARRSVDAAVDRPIERTDWASLFERGRGAGFDAQAGRDVAPWSVPVAFVAVALTLVALVRPLEAGAPWFASCGLVLGLAAWIAQRSAR